MELLLDPRAKTVPSNYSVIGVDVDLGLPPGYSLTEEAMDKSQASRERVLRLEGV